MVTVITINDKDEKLGFISIRWDKNKVYIHSSPQIPLGKKDLKKLVDTLNKHISAMKNEDER